MEEKAASVTRVILVGIGGATCSGKTTLAKHLNRILPDSVIIHQDDFAPAQSLIPIHPVYGVQDWDSAPGAIDWPRFTSFLREVKATGAIPPDHRSHDHLNEQKDVPLGNEAADRWKTVFEHFKARRQKEGESVVWGLVDGFLLYWNQDVMDQLDLQIFLRVPHDVLKQRRHERHGYHTAEQSDCLEGSLWRDPPEYWEQIVYPAYVEAHQSIFETGDVEHGQLRKTDQGRLLMLEGLQMNMDGLVQESCEALTRTCCI